MSRPCFWASRSSNAFAAALPPSSKVLLISLAISLSVTVLSFSRIGLLSSSQCDRLVDFEDAIQRIILGRETAREHDPVERLEHVENNPAVAAQCNAKVHAFT